MVIELFLPFTPVWVDWGREVWSSCWSPSARLTLLDLDRTLFPPEVQVSLFYHYMLLLSGSFGSSTIKQNAVSPALLYLN